MPRDQKDPTRPLRERTPDELGEYVDSHLIMALNAADLIHGNRQSAEDYLRDRLVAISDSWPDPDALEGEERTRRLTRLRSAIGL